MATKKTHEQLCEERKNSGKRDHQKIKPYIVYDYLMKNSDEEHAVSAKTIKNFLENDCGIAAERRSIYRDIDEINKVLYMLENECTIDEAAAVIDSEDGEEEKAICYNRKLKGFYVKQRKYELNDIRLLAECVYSARFIDEKRAKKLAEVATSFVSEYQADAILHDAFLIDRAKTTNTAVYYSVSIINQAMSRGSDKVRHTPEKIKFKYLKHTIDDVSQMNERRKGKEYVVSPYKLLINDGNYYLLGFDDESKEMRTYRLDRMRGVKCAGEPRDGWDAFAAINLKDYTKRVFSMYGGKKEYVRLRFINPLLDTVIDRFGTKGVKYEKADETHFRVSTDIEISDQFFSWLTGFRKGVMIEEPKNVVEAYKKFLNDIAVRYE